MDKLIIEGPCELTGVVNISPAKNAYLPILAAIILTDKPVRLLNIPDLLDIKTMLKLLSNLGVEIKKEGNATIFNAKNLTSHEATYDLVKTMRASIFVLGPLLARLKKAKVSLPGGCAIGTRPIDIHLENLEKMGVQINLQHGYVEASTEKLKPASMTLSFPSVGATENLMMASVFTIGETVIENAAREPEIDDLAHFLNAMGAKISGMGTSRIVIQGVEELQATTYQAIGDRIEAATYVMAALATNSELKIKNINPTHLDFVLQTVEKMGAKIECSDQCITVKKHSGLKAVRIDTAPYPGYPTDAQAQLMALCAFVEGTSSITENIFENRFMHVPELMRMGVDVTLKGHTALVHGGKKCTGAPVMCTDLRASAALVIAALGAQGRSDISRIYHLDRGYENLVEKLKNCGAKIRREKE